MKRLVRDIGERGRRLLLSGLSVAFACGFAGFGAAHEGARASQAEARGGVAAAAGGVATALAAATELVSPAEPGGASGAETDAGAVVPSVRPRRPRTFAAAAADAGELAWRAVHGGVDGTLWRAAGAAAEAPGHGHGLAGVGFPSIASAHGRGRRVYRPMIAWHDAPGGRVPLARVRCMGLSPAAVARRAARYEPRIVALATEHGVSASLVKAVITEESCFDPEAVSHAGATGLMQLMPATARWLGVADPRDPAQNLAGGIRYLAMLRERYGDTALALAAYNAGPGNVARYGGIPPFRETRRYVTRVMAHHRRYVAATSLAAR